MTRPPSKRRNRCLPWASTAFDRAAGELLGPAVGPRSAGEASRARRGPGPRAPGASGERRSGWCLPRASPAARVRGSRAAGGSSPVRRGARAPARRGWGCRRGRWPGSAACAAGTFDPVQAHRGEHEAVALVEAQRREVVVGGDQVHPRAARRAGGLGHRLDQRAADAAADRQCVEGDELAVVVVDQVGGQAGALAVGLGDEGGQLGRPVLAPAADDALAPALAHDRAPPRRALRRAARARAARRGARAAPGGCRTGPRRRSAGRPR